MFYAYKKQIIITSILAVIAIAGLVVVNYLNSFQDVTLQYDKTEGMVKIYDSSNRETFSRTVNPNETLTVKKGDYVLEWSGDRITSDTHPLQVGDVPVSETITFAYSSEYLAELLEEEYPLIASQINQSYPQIQSLYTISRTQLYNRGEWFGAVLIYRGEDTNNRDSLRLLAKKQNDEWKIVSNPPTPLLTVQDYPDTPREVIVDINQPAPLPGAPNSPPLDENGAIESIYD